MFDGSKYPIEQNMKMTSELIDLCKQKGMSIEAEVGTIGGEKEGVLARGEYADPNECKQMAKLEIDMLAAGIGNIHGVYPEDWEGLSFETLGKIKSQIGEKPLVLHGGTGIPDDMIKEAISHGIAKINVNTECQIEFVAGLRNYLKREYNSNSNWYDSINFLQAGFDKMAEKIKEKIILFGSYDRVK